VDAIDATMRIATSGMRAQSLRLRVVSENVANANSTGSTPGADPYRRKTVSFQSVLDRKIGAEVVGRGRIGTDRSDFRLNYDPAHPAADDRGYVKMPNVNTLIEMADMREAARGYEANVTVIEQAKAMASRTIDLLRD
jgi:flagellar basal-body rod protein FlgC